MQRNGDEYDVSASNHSSQGRLVNGAALESKPHSITPDQESSIRDRAQNNTIPVSHIRALQAAYGDQVNLYRDVLKLKPNATERQVRIAYFREGRMILTEDELSPTAKRQFEAISLAYEILSQWRDIYDAYDGDLNKLLNVSSIADAETQPPVNIQRPTQAVSSPAPLPEKTKDNMPSANNASRGIHWKENVEKWLYEEDPKEERFKDMNLEEPVDKREPKKGHSNHSEVTSRPESERSTKILVDAMSLAKHLKSFDSRIVNNFLDHEAFEESLGGFFECLSHDGNPQKDNNRTPKKSNTANRFNEDSFLDLYQSLKDENTVSPKGVMEQSPKDQEREVLSRDLFKERCATNFDERSSDRLHRSSQDGNNVRLVFTEDPFAGLKIFVPASSELPPEFRPYNIPQTGAQRLVDTQISVTERRLGDLPTVDEKTPQSTTRSSQAIDQSYQKVITSNPLHTGYNQDTGLSASRKAVAISKDTGVPIGTVDLKRFRSHLSTNSGITFEDATTANESASASAFCDDAFLEHVSVYFKQLGEDMNGLSHRVNTEMNKLGATVGTTILQYSQNASVGICDVGQTMSQNWEQANQAIISSIKSMADEAGKDNTQIQTARTV